MRFFFLAFIFHTAGGQNCTFPSSLQGSWTTTNLGAVNISSGTPSMTTTLTLTGLPGTINFNCVYIDGSRYILQSTATISVFSGTASVYAYMCMDITQASAYSSYFYMQSDTEVGFGGRRMVGLATSTATIAQVCTTTVGTEEFHTMIKIGNENDAVDAVRCPDHLLGVFRYTYTDNTGTYCSAVNTSTINTCDSWNLTTIYVNNTGCTQKIPFYSSDGLLGCLFSVYNSTSQIYYTSLYNLDTTIAAGTTHRFTCVASAAVADDANGTVLLSMVPTDCVAGQDTTTLQTGGALMELTPECVPEDATTTTTSYIWLIPVLLVISLFIVLTIIGVCLYLRHRKFLKDKAREKNILISDEHPLGEMSITLDAPASLERVAMPFEETTRSELARTPRSGRKGMTNPLSESSLHLDFKGRSWSTFYSGKGLKSPQGMDPFTEMDNGMVVPLSQQGSKTTKSAMNQKQKSFIHHGKARTMVNGDVRRKPLPITDSREVYPDFENPDVVETLTAHSVKSMKTVYDPNDNFTSKAQSVAARREKPRSIKAPSVMALSVKAPTVKATNVKAPSVKAPSVKAPSMKARSLKAPSVRASMVKSAKTTGGKSARSRLTRSLTTTKIGSITKRLTSPRKKALERSSTVVMQSKRPADETDENMADFLAGEMAITRAPSEGGRSRQSNKTSVSKSPRKKTERSVVTLPEPMTDEDKIEELMRVNAGLAQGTINPGDERLRDSFFSKTRNRSQSTLKPKASKKPWKG